MGGFGPYVHKRERCLYYNTAKRPKRKVGGEDEVAVTSELKTHRKYRRTENIEKQERDERTLGDQLKEGKKRIHTLQKNEGRLGKADGHL